MDNAVEPLVAAMRARVLITAACSMRACMVGPDGAKVIEYNVRFGDPEAQVVLPLLASDAAELFMATATGRLSEIPAPRFTGDSAVCVVLASPGYPDAPQHRGPIEGLDASGQSVAEVPATMTFHAGTRRESPTVGSVTAGGRVLAVTAVRTHARARPEANAMPQPHLSHWDGCQIRTDIAADAAKATEEGPSK